MLLAVRAVTEIAT